MYLYKPIAKHIVIPLYAFKDKSKCLRYLSKFEHTQYLCRDEIMELRLSAVQRIVRHAYDNCPYYRKKYAQSDFHPNDLVNLKEFENIPILEKKEIQEHVEEMVAENISKEEITENFTGGSTGRPLRLYHDRDRHDSRMAGIIRHNRWAGLDLGDKVACLWGATRDISALNSIKSKVRNLLVERTLFLDTSMVTRKTMAEFVRRLSRFRPRFFLAYANSIALFARYIKEKKLVGSIVPESIISSAEVLTTENRRLVESVFQCKVFDRYACREASMLASECDQHDGMHINAESVHLEFTKGDTAVGQGELGEILLTDLLNVAMPLIRYRIGDAGIPTDKTCPCGRELPMMKVAAGRVTDFIVTAEGNLVSGVVLSTYVITKVPELRQVQFFQDRPGSMIARLVAAGEAEDKILSNLTPLMSDYLGNNMKIEMEFVEIIPKEESGKFRFTISELNPLEYLI